MIHPASIVHLGVEYSLRHLAPGSYSFCWIGEDKTDLQFQFRVRYSSHCYSVGGTPFPDPADGAYSFLDNNWGNRLFDPARHADSLHLPEIIGGLFTKPTTAVGMTAESNWSIYVTKLPHALQPGHNYYAFFRVRTGTGADDPLELYVESAYQRDQPVRVISRFPFGRVAERISKGVRF